MGQRRLEPPDIERPTLSPGKRSHRGRPASGSHKVAVAAVTGIRGRRSEMASKVPGKEIPGETGARPGQLSWRGAVADVWRSVRRHKIISAVIAIVVVGSLAAIGVAGTASSGSGSSSAAASGASAAPKVAAAFRLPALGAAGGQQVSLSAYAGKPVVVNFFA